MLVITPNHALAPEIRCSCFVGVSDAIENSYYSMLIKKIMDLIKVNGEIACAIKTAVKAKNAGLGEKIPS